MTQPASRLHVGPRRGTAGTAIVLLCLALLTRDRPAVAIGAFAASPPISSETPDGRPVCNAGAAYSQIPGKIDMFVGRGFGVGTLDYCHAPRRREPGFLALFRMDWARSKMLMSRYLLRPPERTSARVWSAYDPYAVAYNGKVWIAFECAIPGSTSSCIAPMTPDLAGLDLSRLTVAVQGNTEKSASSPVLLKFGNRLYMYWSIDFEQGRNRLPANTLISRGMELREDGYGRLWGAGSEDRPVATDNPRLTSLVRDIDAGDTTADHVAVITDAVGLGRRILAISSIGGTAGQEVCRSTHDLSPGCWRISLSIADAPLGPNVFGRRIVDLPSLPGNVVEYPRVVFDPAGRKVLLGNFQPPKIPGSMRGRPQVPASIRYIPFDSIVAAALRSP
jgi:hypothetical protein